MIQGPHLVLGSGMDTVDMEKVALVVVVVVVLIGLVGLMVAGGVLMVGTVGVNLVVMEDMVLVVVWGSCLRRNRFLILCYES